MRIVDVCAFYSPAGGGVRTYVDAKLRAAARFGHELIVIAPGKHHETIRRGPGAILVTLPSPKLPVDQRYRYFDDQRALHHVLNEWQPDHVEASSPWSSATMVGRWDGAATRSLVMHSDPLAAYAYRWLGGIAKIDTIDSLARTVLAASSRSQPHVRCCRLRQCTTHGSVEVGGLANSETLPMGVEAGIFSPRLRSPAVRAAALQTLGLNEDALLLVGIGRFSGEKRWDMVMRAVEGCSARHEVGLLLFGDGPKRQKLEVLDERLRSVAVMPRLSNRDEVARLLASADALVHGCEAETFCMVAAEARASGIPLIVPDRGAAMDQLVPGAGLTYSAASERSLERAIARFINRGPEFQRAAAARASDVRTMDAHFADLFERYAQILPAPLYQPAAGLALLDILPEVSLARSVVSGA